jgi:hypothetical protein
MRKSTEELSVSNGNGLTWGKLITFGFIVAMAAFSGTYVKDRVDPPRPDQFTGKDAQLMELRLMNVINRESDMIRRNMPPKKTRDRIRSVERWIEAQDPQYEPATDLWSE